jgi:outer membrane protein assembly factor BamB
MNQLFSSLLTFSLLAVLNASANSWPQYRGPRGDGISSESIPSTLPTEGPKCVWKVPVNGGFSSFAVSDSKVLTVVSREAGGENSETCVALDTQTGKEVWATRTGRAKYRGGADSGTENNKGGDGPRSTPAVVGNRVFVYSSDMVLSCLDADSGKVVWSKDILKDFAGRTIGWESASSPVVEGKLVYIVGGGAGQSILAFAKDTGEVAWKAGDELMTHATPVMTTLHGVRQIVFFVQSGLLALNPESGKELWRQAFPYKVSTASLPVIGNNMVLCTAGYEIGGAGYEVMKTDGAFSSKELWRAKGNKEVASLWSPPVYRDGCVYGMISFKQFGNGPLKCVDLKTGAIKWEKAGFGAGNVLLAGDKLIALADDGQVVIVKASPDSYQELGRFKALEGKCWTSPALADGKLYVRSTKEGACFDLGSGK